MHQQVKWCNKSRCYKGCLNPGYRRNQLSCTLKVTYLIKVSKLHQERKCSAFSPSFSIGEKQYSIIQESINLILKRLHLQNSSNLFHQFIKGYEDMNQAKLVKSLFTSLKLVMQYNELNKNNE